METHRSEFSVMKMCSALHVSTSGFYKWLKTTPSQQEIQKTRIMERITFHFNDSKQRYGSPKLTALLRKEGFTVTERTVTNYMQELGIRSCVSRKFNAQTTDSNHNDPIAPNLLNQQFHVVEPNRVWAADITYIPCREGRLYLASLLDLCTREIVGWRLGERMTTDLVLGALEEAYQKQQPGKGLLHHSDRGTQYASTDYREQLQLYNMQASMSRKGNCYDNACIESFHSVLKKELIYCTKFHTREQAKQAIFEYIELFYNRKRIHSSLGYLSPVQFSAQFLHREVS
ncbi:IS3 family transposase [Priestia megaterium]|uniref:IS3 family transposase n=1 Tax=Priestia megaterium TaxID=1404 RepID=UPI00363C592D